MPRTLCPEDVGTGFLPCKKNKGPATSLDVQRIFLIMSQII